MKFKVGDKVRVKEWKDVLKESGAENDHSPGAVWAKCSLAKIISDVCGLVFTVTECHESMCSYSISGLNRFGHETKTVLIEELLEPVCDVRIAITTDGKVTLARLYEDGKVVKKATARCSPDDKFDFSVGAKIAFERLTKTTHAEPKYYNGKVVCVETKNEEYAYTVGKIYEFKNGRVKIGNGREVPCTTRVTSLDEWNDSDWAMAKFIEIK